MASFASFVTTGGAHKHAWTNYNLKDQLDLEVLFKITFLLTINPIIYQCQEIFFHLSKSDDLAFSDFYILLKTKFT